MPDISMCNVAGCLRAVSCKRHKASGTEPNVFWQSYIKPEQIGIDCKMYYQTPGSLANEAIDKVIRKGD